VNRHSACQPLPIHGRNLRPTPILIAACALTLLATGSSAGAALLKPDEKVLDRGPVRLCQEAPNALRKQDRCHGRGRVVIRTSTLIGNAGVGPLEYAPVPRAQDRPRDCHGDGRVDVDGDGVPDDNDTLVRQIIYEDHNGNGTFERSVDTRSKKLVIACRYFHPAHNHYHVEGFAELALRRDATDRIVRRGQKISFCVADSGLFAGGLPGSPVNPFYREVTCNHRLAVQGTSIGWYDLYGWALPGQQIDITGIPAGNYCFIVSADPQNRLRETNNHDNTRRYHVFVDPAQAPVNGFKTLTRLNTPCP
jgi:Lysyl oxidase